MAKNPVIGLFDTYDAARQAVTELEKAGIAHADISIVTNNSDGSVGAVDTAPGGETGARVGSAVGGVAGGATGLLAALGLVAIPGIGPIAAAGAVLATLTGAGAGVGLGSTIGGLVGALTEVGVSKEDSEFYAEALRRGGTVLVVDAPDDKRASADALLSHFSRVDVGTRRTAYQAGGWKSFDPDAAPLSSAEIAAERARYHGADSPIQRGTVPKFPA